MRVKIILKNRKILLFLALLFVFFIIYLSFKGYTELKKSRSLQVATLSLKEAGEHQQKGEIDRAIEKLQKSIRYFKKYDGTQTTQQITPMNKLGEIYNE